MVDQAMSDASSDRSHSSPASNSSSTRRNPSKASIGFICAPSFEIPSYERYSTPPHASPLEQLPHEILSQVALHLVISHHHDNPAPNRSTPPPSPLLPLLLLSKKMHSLLSFDDNPNMYRLLYLSTFDISSLYRRYAWMKIHLSAVAERGDKLFNLFDNPKSWAEDYRTRWMMAKRMKEVVKSGKISEEDLVNSDLWNSWFLLTENGTSNLS
jgi:hypothetical protein